MQFNLNRGCTFFIGLGFVHQKIKKIMISWDLISSNKEMVFSQEEEMENSCQF